jgi:hypothetical protein
MKAIAKSIILLSFLLAVQVYAVPDPGRIYSSPRVLDDTLNTNSFAWTGIWLHNPSDSFGVVISGITSNQSWLTIMQSSGYISQNDSFYVPLMLSSSGISGGTATCQITIHHNGYNSPRIVDVIMHIMSDSPNGALIDVSPRQFMLNLEPYLNGQLKIQVSNTGDLPLRVTHSQTSTPLLSPIVDTATITPMAPAELLFAINTNFGENINLVDSIVLYSDASNNPVLSIPIVAHILPDSVGGTYPLGDVNLDGWCNIEDAIMIQRYLAGMISLPCMTAADVNNSGYINGLDVTYLIRYLKKLGPPPVNSCALPPISFPSHQSGREISIDFLTAHRGEWINTPVRVQTPSYYSMQASLGFEGDIIDSVNATNISGLPSLLPHAVLLDTFTGSKSIVLFEEDVQVTRSPIPIMIPMPLYSLQMHIPMNAPSGSHPILPVNAADRGPSSLDPNGSSLEAPMFTGTNLTIAPRVALSKLSGVGELIYVPDSTIIYPSITVYCDGPEIGDVYMVIRDSSGTIEYTDTLRSVSIHLGENQFTFTNTWIARGGRNYIAGAGVVVNGDDYPTDNFGGIRINMTNQITIGLPPTEDFEPGLILDFPPVGYSVVNRPDPPGGSETWVQTSLKALSGTYSVAILGQTDDVEDEWFVKGPMDWSSVNEPAIQFYEAQDDWTDYGYKHEFYVYIGSEFNVEDAIDDGPILTHTPGTHTISSNFLTAPLEEIDLSAYGNTDNIWFAFRYVKDPEKALGDNWYLDDIGWVDNAPGPGGYEYIPGDANMGIVSWPTMLEGGDVIRLVRYFKGLAPACLFHNPLAHHAPAPDTLADTVFYAAADANGNCETRGSDVTRLVAYFKGNAAAPDHCIDYPPITPVQANFPACTAPALKK